jgi:hypothetical protein
MHCQGVLAMPNKSIYKENICSTTPLSMHVVRDMWPQPVCDVKLAMGCAGQHVFVFEALSTSQVPDDLHDVLNV